MADTFPLPFAHIYLLSPKIVKLLSPLFLPRSAMTSAYFNSIAFGAVDFLSLIILSPLADVTLSWFSCPSDHALSFPLGPEILFLRLFSSCQFTNLLYVMMSNMTQSLLIPIEHALCATHHISSAHWILVQL